MRETSTSTGAPAARARSDGHMLAAKGTAAPKPAAPPSAEVATMRLRRVLLTFSLSLMKMAVLEEGAKVRDCSDAPSPCPRFGAEARSFQGAFCILGAPQM